MEPLKDLSKFSPTKICRGPCGRDLPRTPEYFEPCRVVTHDSLRNSCRDCERARDAAYRRHRKAGGKRRYEK